VSGPTGIDFDSSGNLWVADTGNNRVLEFLKSGFTNGEAASLEIGQPSGSSAFTSNTGATTQSGLNSPVSVRFDSGGNLWVTDETNYRELEFCKTAGGNCVAGFANGELASIEIGQPSSPAPFTTAAHPNVELMFTATNPSPSGFHVKILAASVQDFYKNPNSITLQVANNWASTSHIVDVFITDSSGVHCFSRLPSGCAASLLPSSGTALATSTATIGLGTCSGSGTCLSDSTGTQGTWTPGEWVSSAGASNYNFVYLISGTGAGDYGTITANTANSGSTTTVTVGSWTGPVPTPSGGIGYFIGQTWSGIFVAPGTTGVITLPYTWSTGPVTIKVTTDLGNTVVLSTIAS
jgi:hypothetical protein